MYLFLCLKISQYQSSKSGMYSRMSFGWQFKLLQISFSNSNLIAFTLPLLRSDMLTSLMPTWLANSFEDILRSAKIRSNLKTITNNTSFCKIITYVNIISNVLLFVKYILLRNDNEWKKMKINEKKGIIFLVNVIP